ncbi:MAG TPA: hypothetical protein VEW26_02795, partial [Allosphingosinicella sp.]|nr:hypothetical protein [Allosphingosinicella sp.]
GRYLANPRLRLTDVADLLGYASLAAFSRWHVERFGESPSTARRRIRRRREPDKVEKGGSGGGT